ncbi:hypothetical protein SOHN41_01977 [Shewanella sp. HN-41]|nr:hypothetical protein SOHN41_01977 [Shewanella sp. HN-41]
MQNVLVVIVAPLLPRVAKELKEHVSVWRLVAKIVLGQFSP